MDIRTLLKQLMVLEKFETTNGEVTTERRNILHFISDMEGITKKMLVEYSQLGLVFIFTVNGKPNLSYNLQIASSLSALEAVSYSILKTVSNGMLVIDDLRRTLREMIEVIQNISAFAKDSA